MQRNLNWLIANELSLYELLHEIRCGRPTDEGFALLKEFRRRVKPFPKLSRRLRRLHRELLLEEPTTLPFLGVIR